MTDKLDRFNKPLSDDALYSAGVTREVPEREPVPPAPPVLPEDVNLFSPGVEYRAMPGFVAPPIEQPIQDDVGPDKPGGDAFGWLAARRKG